MSRKIRRAVLTVFSVFPDPRPFDRIGSGTEGFDSLHAETSAVIGIEHR